MHISEKLKQYKQPEIKESKLEQFQEYAIKICDEFGITGFYRQIIFRHAKRNKCYLEGKVALCYEKFGTENLKTKGRYLCSLFRKKAPWIK